MCCNFHELMKLASRRRIVRASGRAVVYNRRPMRRREHFGRRAGALIAGAIAIAAAVDATMGATTTANVTVQNMAVGVTPRYIGYNMGHYMPGSNTSAWL